MRFLFSTDKVLARVTDAILKRVNEIKGGKMLAQEAIDSLSLLAQANTDFINRRKELIKVDGSKPVNKASKDLPEVSQKLSLIEPGQTASRLKLYFPEWHELTSDPQILKTHKGFNADFADCPPVQMFPPKEISFSSEESQIISSELDTLLTNGIIVKSQHCHGEFLSTILLRKKKTGGYRLILNLKNLNQYISYHHFKMESKLQQSCLCRVRTL